MMTCSGIMRVAIITVKMMSLPVKMYLAKA